MAAHISAIITALFAMALALTPTSSAWAAEPKKLPEQATPSDPNAPQGEHVEGSGFSLFDTESIKGFDESKVQKDPVCDRSKRPRIVAVEPDEVKPGDKVVIRGENFGAKECIQSVTFSSAAGSKIEYKYVNDSTIEAKVPDSKAGMSFVIVVAGSGSAQSKPVLIKK
jgi:hypothetical protein